MNQLQRNMVSVIIPTYGRPLALKRAIDSVLFQTYKDFEIIVVDDNNPQDEGRKQTVELMMYYQNNQNVRYIKHDMNRNGAAARNTGIKNSNGAFLCFLDDDDWFLPPKLGKQIEYLSQNSEFNAVYCGWIKNDKRYYPSHSGDLTKELLMMDYQPMTPTLMFRREAIEVINGFDESYRRHQDYELMLRFFEKYKLSFVDECLVGIGCNDGSNNIHGNDLEELKNNFLKKFERNIFEIEKKEKGSAKRIYSKHYARVFLNHLHYCHYGLAAKILCKYILYSPSNFTEEIWSTIRRYIKYKTQKFSLWRK